MHSWIAIAGPGLEPILARELEGLGVQGQLRPGAITSSASLADGARLTRQARTPTRLLLRVAEGPVTPTRQPGDLVRRSHAAADRVRLALDAGGECSTDGAGAPYSSRPTNPWPEGSTHEHRSSSPTLHGGKRVGIWVIQA